MNNRDNKLVPWLWLIVGGGVAIAVVLVLMAQVGARQAATWTYSSSSPTAAPVSELCSCSCISAEELCTHRWQRSSGECTDDDWDFTSITDTNECSSKEGGTCRGYESGIATTRTGKLAGCDIVAAP